VKDQKFMMLCFTEFFYLTGGTTQISFQKDEKLGNGNFWTSQSQDWRNTGNITFAWHTNFDVIIKNPYTTYLQLSLTFKAVLFGLLFIGICKRRLVRYFDTTNSVLKCLSKLQVKSCYVDFLFAMSPAWPDLANFTTFVKF